MILAIIISVLAIIGILTIIGLIYTAIEYIRTHKLVIVEK